MRELIFDMILIHNIKGVDSGELYIYSRITNDIKQIDLFDIYVSIEIKRSFEIINLF